ncbi:PAS domain S-box protein [Heliobacterium chlorum]|uniref:histidine kinase n=1 Tax=Heliobacterium chlorum TaxID=2698 RepID=A0ABR7T0V8_HELCL|nr:ATP-binding protein [Heliobacterium chlorum]MBC9784424.1 PAS domain S-box protein [Heliobacterium chlorum]
MKRKFRRLKRNRLMHLESALRASEERFYKVFHENPAMVSMISVWDGVYFDVNQSWLSITGYKREEVIGRSIFDLDFLISFNQSRDGFFGETNKGCEIVFQTKEKERRNGLQSSSIINIDGKDYVLAITYDITDKKKMEKELSRLDRLNLIGQLAGGIGHEIRNPLTTVKGFLQLMHRKDELYDFQEYIELMISELDRANTIITDFLSLSKTKSLFQSPEDINSIIQKMFPLLRAHAFAVDKQIDLELNTVSDILGDEKELRQLILNLVQNGLDASAPRQFVTIKTYMDESNVVLEINDRGKGIPKEILDKIGTPFFTTKDRGTGLGLAVCYGIVERHRARIRVETSEKGTSFIIAFPRNNM